MKDEAFGIVPILRQEDGEKFLLIQHHAGHWGFPKGHADPGETAIAAARREFEEETGITAYELLGETSFAEEYSFIRHKINVRKTVTYFPAVVTSDVVTCQAKEIKDYAWLPYEAAVKKITFSPARQLLVQVYDHLKQSGTQ